ncbi:MAG: hypothetical protein HDQ91_04765 [Desulfovibrio sp.]|nr:hypothetical protein [Desulfovibrio sp.]
MKPEFELKPGRLFLEEREASVEEFLGLAAQYQKNAWLMAESPRRFVFRAFDGELDGQLRQEAMSLIVFGPEAEIRFERPFGDQTGWLRLARPESGGRECLFRRVSALLRDGSGGKLLYEEFYQPDESGFLVKFCGRLCGVEAS